MKGRWLSFAALFIICTFIGINMFKVPPIMGTLGETFQIGSSQLSWLISVFTVAGVILSLPCSTLLNKAGPKKFGIFLMLCLVAGSVIGTFAPNYPVLLFSRVLEGISFSGMIFLEMVLVGKWFKPHEMGIPVGLILCTTTIGQAISFQIAAPITARGGWKSLWLIGIILAVISLVLYVTMVKTPKEEPADEAAGAEEHAGSLAQAFCNKRTILAGIMSLLAAVMLYTFLNLYAQIYINLYNVPARRRGLLQQHVRHLQHLYSAGLGLYRLQIPQHRQGDPHLRHCRHRSYGLDVPAGSGTYILTPSSAPLSPACCSTPSSPCPPWLPPSPPCGRTRLESSTASNFVGSVISVPIVSARAEKGGWASTSIPLLAVCVLEIVFSVIFPAHVEKARRRPAEAPAGDYINSAPPSTPITWEAPNENCIAGISGRTGPCAGGPCQAAAERGAYLCLLSQRP